jgi:hypothetical protein
MWSLSPAQYQSPGDIGVYRELVLPRAGPLRVAASQQKRLHGLSFPPLPGRDLPPFRGGFRKQRGDCLIACQRRPQQRPNHRCNQIEL